MSRHHTLVAVSLLLSSSTLWAAPKQAPPPPPFVGTVTYASIEPAFEKRAWTLVTDGRRHGVSVGGDKRWGDVDGTRYHQRRDGFAELATSSALAPTPATKLPPRKIAGRTANCLRLVPATLPDLDPRPDHLEACQYEDANAISFIVIDNLANADIDGAFAAHGLRGVPASVALVGPQGVFRSWTATKLDRAAPAAQALDKDVFLRLATAKDLCLAKLDTGRALVKSAMIAQESWRAENDVFITDLDKLGFENTAPTLYTVKVESVSATGYVIVATGIGEAAGDQWRIDESTKAVHVKTAACP